MEFAGGGSGRFKPVKLTRAQKRKIKEANEKADLIRKQTLELEEIEKERLELEFDKKLEELD